MTLNVRRSTIAWAALALLVAHAHPGEFVTDFEPGEASAASVAGPTPYQLPARLSDSDYRTLVESLSEPDGSFHSENFVSNEGTFQRFIPILAERIPAQGVYLGVGPEQNFSYISALRPRMAFIVDIRRQNLVQHLMYKALFELAPTRAEFLSRLFSRPPPGRLPDTASTDALFLHYSSASMSESLYERNLAQVMDHLVQRKRFRLSAEDSADLQHVYGIFRSMGPNIRYMTPLDGPDGGRYTTLMQMMMSPDDSGVNRSFLGTEQSYRRVRDLHLANLIVPVVGDFAGPKALRAIGQYLREHGAAVTAFYVSNVESYLFRTAGTAQRFYANVESMPLDSLAVFIRPPSGVMPRNTTANVMNVRTETLQVRQIGRETRAVVVRKAPNGEILDGTTIVLGPIGRIGQPPYSSIPATLAAVNAGQIRRYSDVFRIGGR